VSLKEDKKHPSQDVTGRPAWVCFTSELLCISYIILQVIGNGFFANETTERYFAKLVMMQILTQLQRLIGQNSHQITVKLQNKDTSFR